MRKDKCISRLWRYAYQRQTHPEGFHTITAHLLVEDGDRQIQFLKQAFDAVELHISRLPNGRIMHAEVKIGDSIVMIGEACDAWKLMPAMIQLYVEDVVSDELERRFVANAAAQ